MIALLFIALIGIGASFLGLYEISEELWKAIILTVAGIGVGSLIQAAILKWTIRIVLKLKVTYWRVYLACVAAGTLGSFAANGSVLLFLYLKIAVEEAESLSRLVNFFVVFPCLAYLVDYQTDAGMARSALAVLLMVGIGLAILCGFTIAVIIAL